MSVCDGCGEDLDWGFCICDADCDMCYSCDACIALECECAEGA